LDKKAIELAKKIYELVKQGVDGEKTSAEKHLLKVLRKYGLTMADIEGEKREARRFKVYSDDQAYFLEHIIWNVAGDITVYMAYQFVKENPLWKNVVYVELTDAEFIEASEKFKFFWKHYYKEKKQIESDARIAFCLRNGLYLKGKTVDLSKLSKEDQERREKLQKLGESFGKHNFHKSLPSGK